MNNTIEHDGIVARIGDDKVYVRIEQLSACASCHAKGLCTTSESEEKEIEALCRGERFDIGDAVTVVGQKSLGMKAVLLAYVVPFFVILLALLIFNQVGMGELWAGTLSLCTLLPYFLILRLFKNKLEAQFRFYAVRR